MSVGGRVAGVGRTHENGEWRCRRSSQRIVHYLVREKWQRKNFLVKIFA